MMVGGDKNNRKHDFVTEAILLVVGKIIIT